MKIKHLLIGLSIALLTGCQSASEPTKDTKQYDGMNGKETYEAAIGYFNEHVNYFKSLTVEGGNQLNVETYHFNNKYSAVKKELYLDSELSTLNYNIISGSDFHSLYMIDSQTYKYNLVNDYAQTVEEIYTDYTKNENYEVIDIQREDKNDQIILTLKLKMTQVYQESDETGSTTYFINEITINKEGYISHEKKTYYLNDQFKDVIQDEVNVENSDFNKKTNDDLEKEIELMQSCDGLNDDEVRDKIGLK